MKKSQVDAYRKVYHMIADEIGSHRAVILLADMEPGTEAMALLGDWFTDRTHLVHDLDPKHAEKLGYKL